MRFLIFCLVFQVSTIHSQTVGVVEYEEGVASGYTVLSPMGFDTTYLIDPCGNAIKKWPSVHKNAMFAAITTKGTLVKSALDPNTSHFVGGGASGILLEYDWDGKLIWEYKISDSTQRLHHDLEVLPNGNILGVAWEIKGYKECVQAGGDPEKVPSEGLWFTVVYEIQPVYPESANIVWEWHAWDHLVQDIDKSVDNFGTVSSSFRRMDINKGISKGKGRRKGKQDWAHVNGIHYNEALDHIALSAPKFNEIWIIDHSTTTSEAASSSGGKRGKGGDLLWRWGNPASYNSGNSKEQELFFQHNCEWVEEGTRFKDQISVFSNRDTDDTIKVSKVKIIDAAFDKAKNEYPLANGKFLPSEASYTYQLADSLNSPRISGVQVLPNDNLLICSGSNGHIIEIDREENVRWQYVVPISQKGRIANQGEILPKKKSIFTVHKYPLDYEGFRNRLFNSSGQIEQSPLPCNGPFK